LLTPLLSLQVGTKLAVAAVSIPHFLGSAVRCWMLRRHINRQVLLGFGIASAAGGLVGALAHATIQDPALSLIFGIILVIAGVLGATGSIEKLRFSGWLAWLAGASSGALGGLVGNQGGIRSAAMLGFELNPSAFVATATAIGLFVDAARMPVYFAVECDAIARIWPLVAVATTGVLAGTFLGDQILKKVHEKTFKRSVSAIIIMLGIVMLWQSEHEIRIAHSVEQCGFRALIATA
jgi:uncharacterized membrane protein YfcA